jgi:hypothetical protein
VSGNTADGASALQNNISGQYNTAVGWQALQGSSTDGGEVGNATGSHNTAIGAGALYDYSTGSNNTASGFEALYNDQVGSSNTANGYFALQGNNGSYNTATGTSALQSNNTGTYNTASGYQALISNNGSDNTATGADSLYNNTTGGYNTASGMNALYSNTSADYNTASGYGALYATTTGNSNTASGYEALYGNTSGTQNTATGLHALAANTTGSNNIAEGYHAGYNLTTGSNNIDIGSPGVKAESGVIRIGTITGTTSTQSAAYVAGIYGVKTATTGTAVFIDSSGQLGTVSSSVRYKEDIQPMAAASERLLNLRPVKFRYKKADASGEKPVQYGLIAEEVAAVFPELVLFNKDGQPETVAYHILPTLLLNEYQKEHNLNQEQSEKMALLQKQFDAQSVKLANLERLTEALAAANGIDPAKVQQLSQSHADLSRAVAATR